MADAPVHQRAQYLEAIVALGNDDEAFHAVGRQVLANASVARKMHREVHRAIMVAGSSFASALAVWFVVIGFGEYSPGMIVMTTIRGSTQGDADAIWTSSMPSSPAVTPMSSRPILRVRRRSPIGPVRRPGRTWPSAAAEWLVPLSSVPTGPG